MHTRTKLIANAEPNQADGAIARPASRAATGFVPRLGKRFDQRAAATLERMTLLEALLRRISTQNGYNPRVYASPSPPMPALYSEGQFSEQLPGSQNEQPLDEMLELLVPRRETRASEGSDELIGGLESAMSSSSSGSKRVAFTPRIGR